MTTCVFVLSASRQPSLCPSSSLSSPPSERSHSKHKSRSGRSSTKSAAQSPPPSSALAENADAKKQKKAAKKAAHDAEVAAERELLAGAMDEEAAGGPRAPTRAIMANKGLTPKRAKAVRNPRVKKRMRFEKAQRKVASQRAVYKGGLSATGGRYEGEKSGISKVVKSVKLS